MSGRSRSSTTWRWWATLGQHPRRAEGRPEDRRAAAAHIRQPRRRVSQRRRKSPARWARTLRAGLDARWAFLSRKLATLDTDVELPLGLDDLTPRDAGPARSCRSSTRATNCARCCASSTAAMPAPRMPPRPRRPRRLPRRRCRGARAPLRNHPEWPRSLESWLAQLRSADLFAFDTETTSLDYMKAEIVGVSFCVEPGEAAYVPLAHDYAGAPEQLDRAQRAGGPEAAAGGPASAQARTPPQVRRPCAGQPRHPAGRHALRHHAGILRAGTAWRPVTTWIPGAQKLPGLQDHHTTRTWRARARSRSDFDQVRVERRQPSMPPKTPT